MTLQTVQLPFRWPTRKPPSPDSQARLLTQGAVSPVGAAADRGYKRRWLSRALYRCRFLPLADIAPGERRAVLRNLLLAWAPFDQAEYRVAWQGDAALAVAWDRTVVERLMSPAGGLAAVTLWPETFLRAPPGKDGLRVVQCLEGVEAQLWRNGSLQASRWWPQQPEAADAQAWIRSLGPATASSGLPALAPVAWLHRPWADLHSLGGLSSTTSHLERVAVGAALVGLTALTGAQAHQWLAAFEAGQAVQRDRQRLLLEAAPVLAARDRAETLAREAQRLAEQMNSVSPLDVLLHLSDVLPARGVTLKELELSGPQLRLAIELAPDVQRSALVKDLQAGGWLSKVAEARDNSSRGWVVFDAVLIGQRAPATAPRPVTVAASALPPALPAPSPAAVAAAPAPPAAAAPAARQAAENPPAAPEAQEPQAPRRGFIPSGSPRASSPGKRQ